MKVTPGAISSEYLDDSGNPVVVDLLFVNGCCEVPDNLGRWMVETERASRHRYQIIVPNRSLLRSA